MDYKYLVIYIGIAVSIIPCTKDFVVSVINLIFSADELEKRNSWIGFWSNMLLLIVLSLLLRITVVNQKTDDQSKQDDERAHRVELARQRKSFETIIKRLKVDSDTLSRRNIRLLAILDSNKIDLSEKLTTAGKRYVTSLSKAAKNLENVITGGDSIPVPYLVKTGPWRFMLSLKNNSSFTLTGVNITVINYSALLNCAHQVDKGYYIIDESCYMRNMSTGTYSIRGNSSLYLKFAENLVTRYVHGLIELNVFTLNHKYHYQIITKPIDRDYIYLAYKVSEINADGKEAIVQSDYRQLKDIKSNWDKIFTLPSNYSYGQLQQ